MTTERDPRTRTVLSWLREDAHENAERVLLRALDEVDATPQRRSMWPARRSLAMNPVFKYALAAAAVLAVALAGARFLAPPVDPVSTPGASPAQVPTVAPTQSPMPTMLAVTTAGPLAPGTYVLTAVPSLRITFIVPGNGWQVNAVGPSVIWTSNSEGRFGFGNVDNLYTDPCEPGGGVRDPAVGPTVGELADALANLSGLEPVAPTDVTVSGFAGKLVELNVPSATSTCGGTELSLYPSELGPVPLDGSARHRFWILDVDGTRLVIHAVERRDLGPTYREQLQEILDSIRIQPV